MTLSPITAARISRLVPILASSHDGEALAARNAIGRELFTGRCDWHDLAASVTSGSHPEASSAFGRTAPMAFGDLARACRDLDRGRLSPNERTFVADMVRRGFAFRPSCRQAEWLASIFDRLKRRAAA